jgi:hypothetical protein
LRAELVAEAWSQRARERERERERESERGMSVENVSIGNPRADGDRIDKKFVEAVAQ